jgi:hypothetical protein
VALLATEPVEAELLGVEAGRGDGGRSVGADGGEGGVERGFGEVGELGDVQVCCWAFFGVDLAAVALLGYQMEVDRWAGLSALRWL